MTRYNIFFPIHKGLRAMLYETALCLQQTSFTDTEDAEETLQKMQEVIHLFKKHAHTEDNYILPAIAAYEPSVVTCFEEEHDEDLKLAQDLESVLLSFKSAYTDDAKQKCGEGLTNVFAQFVTFNLTHMAKEERLINEILWRYYSDAELHGITKQIMAVIQPSEMLEYSKWMIRGMNNEEICGWLKGVKNSAPQSQFQSLLTITEQELHPHRWRTVQEALTEGAMIA